MIRAGALADFVALARDGVRLAGLGDGRSGRRRRVRRGRGGRPRRDRGRAVRRPRRRSLSLDVPRELQDALAAVLP